MSDSGLCRDCKHYEECPCDHERDFEYCLPSYYEYCSGCDTRKLPVICQKKAGAV